MAQEQTAPGGPDLTKGVAFADFAGGKLVGHVGDEEVLLVRSGAEVFAIGAHCTHYHGPLAEGSWSARACAVPGITPASICAPAKRCARPRLSPLACWKVEQRDGRIFVKDKRAQPKPRGRAAAADAPGKIVIVGGGAAGFAAAEMLRRRDYRGSIVMLSDDDAPPVDRPNLSKDYLAGSAPEDWLPLRPDEFYAENDIELRLNTEVAGIDVETRARSRSPAASKIHLRPAVAGDRRRAGAAVRSPAPIQPHVHTLRSLADCRAIIERRQDARAARWCIGASFIGLEVAASLRARDIEVHVVAPETRPMERVLGPQLGDFIRALHEEHGVVFHLGETASRDRGRARDAQGRRRARRRSRRRRRRRAAAPGAGRSRPASRSTAASWSMPIWRRARPASIAAGDIARWPDPHTGEAIRVEHWVVAERQGQTAARQHARAAASASTPCRSSGASTTTCRSTMSATPSGGTRSRSTAISTAKDCLRALSDATAACSRSPRSSATSPASRPSWRWSRAPRRNGSPAHRSAGRPAGHSRGKFARIFLKISRRQIPAPSPCRIGLPGRT